MLEIKITNFGSELHIRIGLQMYQFGQKMTFLTINIICFLFWFELDISSMNLLGFFSYRSLSQFSKFSKNHHWFS